MPRPRSLLTEFRRRNVPRAAVIYIAAAWALSQGIAQLAPYVGAPDWVVRWFLVAAVVAFPLWIAFAWFFELTPEGLKRDGELAERDSAARRATARKLDFWIIGILAVAVVLLATNQFVLRGDATSQANAADTQAALAALTKIPAQSVAVLPLANESGDPKRQYFSDGLSEELISDLTQVNGLKVIGNYSSFKFRDSKDSPAQIGATLGVANLIEGSVRQSGERIRIVVNLIRAKDGASVWSHTYDQQLKDVFAIQSQIGHAVASALQVKLLGKAIVSDDRPPSGNVEAYQLMLQGRALVRRQTENGFRQGLALIRQALELEPNYAYAWSLISNYAINLGNLLQGDAKQRAYEEARRAADKASALAPNAPVTHLVRGYVLAQLDGDQMGSLAEYRRALALASNDGTTMDFLAVQYAALGQLQQSVGLYRKAIATDPLRADWFNNLSVALTAKGDFDRAEQAIRKTIELQPDYPGAYLQLSGIEFLHGEVKAAMRDAEKETDPDSRAFALASVKQVNHDAGVADAALHDYIEHYGDTQPFNVADLYALRGQPDEMFQWLQRARGPNGAVLAANLLNDPLALRYKTDPRFAALCKQLGLPAPGEPLPAVSSTTP